jgi:hypothetical protein
MYEPCELGQEMKIWVNYFDGVMPAIGKERAFKKDR